MTTNTVNTADEQAALWNGDGGRAWVDVQPMPIAVDWPRPSVVSWCAAS